MAAHAGTAWDNVHNLVFTNAAGSFLSHRTVYDCFKRIVKSIGMETMRFHDLRHSYAVASIKNGDDIKTVQENLGHATAAFTLDVYAHATNQMKKASADRMSFPIIWNKMILCSIRGDEENGDRSASNANGA